MFDAKYKAYIYGETFLTVNQAKLPIRLEWRSEFDKLDLEAAEKMRRKWEIENRDRLPTFVREQLNEARQLDVVYSPKIKIRPTEIKTFLIFLGDASEME